MGLVGFEPRSHPMGMLREAGALAGVLPPGLTAACDQPEIKTLQAGHGFKLCYGGLLFFGIKALVTTFY